MKIASSQTKDGVLKLINEFYMTTNCIITDNNEVQNTKLNKILGLVKIEKQRFVYYAN